MSYDVHLVRPAPGAEPAELAAALLAREDSDADPGPLSPEAEAWKHALADALQRLDPRLERLTADPVAIARFLDIPVDEARRRNRTLELATPDEGSGMAMTLYDDGATLSMPYGLALGTAARAWREAWSCLQVMQSVGGLEAFDPQLRRPLDLSADIGAVLDRYAQGGATAREHGFVDAARPDPAPAGEKKRPWWRPW